MSTATPRPRRALVTGASSGIGAATVRRLRAEGWDVVATARRADRLAALAQETGADTIVADVTDDADVARLAAQVAEGGPLDVLVNNAGGAFGLDPVESADLAHWRQMYELNVLGTLRVTQALLPQLREGDGGDIVVVTSTAAHGTYEGGAGYVGAKHAERMLATTLRWEILGEPIRIIEIAPGAVATEEFSMVRFDGDSERAAAVYAGYEPLVADDIADAIAWSLSRPAHVNVDLLVVRPRAQASNNKVARTGV
ncbi:SDR family oxidoreductase [Cellulomonas sp. Root137]|uniref:SDR family oxidoreductase n=1 Tax=Cellulomonas sp. Root137 TaxID=1736459 RepID=UPI0006F30802|nr:SDR family oxidoreductase [Cellulomonas sp. Root137]KQY44596.1 oxidoreductase [Cellulomonas sp. Root137]KRD41594.1 oxidoreductase [Cellulomonas sp. Root930]